MGSPRHALPNWLLQTSVWKESAPPRCQPCQAAPFSAATSPHPNDTERPIPPTRGSAHPWQRVRDGGQGQRPPNLCPVLPPGRGSQSLNLQACDRRALPTPQAGWPLPSPGLRVLHTGTETAPGNQGPGHHAWARAAEERALLGTHQKPSGEGRDTVHSAHSLPPGGPTPECFLPGAGLDQEGASLFPGVADWKTLGISQRGRPAGLGANISGAGPASSWCVHTRVPGTGTVCWSPTVPGHCGA